ncbi:tripartite tricarboxylate transporter TctB family protein [Enterocloster clostridioformis]|uniref:tripartite tricarboxylate transporter TctB family protein n=1 Tax=Enterocloster clostridioformis TaxID=1531 RepID=UPI00267687F7|nr:tripartite tricarboxylate transporter TctB family protein [Enterocloster clostridioformis]
MFIKKYGDIIVGVFFMLLSAAMLVMAKMLPKSTVMDIGPDFMPMCIGVMTFVLAAALVFLNIKNMKIYVAQAETEGPEKADYKRVLTSFIIILVYVFVLKSVGFIISTLVYLPVQMFILAPEERRGKKDVIQLLITDVLFTFVVFFLFRYGFKIVLPAGIFTINL